jgi:hypothetical protein
MLFSLLLCAFIAGWQEFYATSTSPCYRCTPGNQPREVNVSGTPIYRNTGCLSRCPVSSYTVTLNKPGRRSNLLVGNVFMT